MIRAGRLAHDVLNELSASNGVTAKRRLQIRGHFSTFFDIFETKTSTTPPLKVRSHDGSGMRKGSCNLSLCRVEVGISLGTIAGPTKTPRHGGDDQGVRMEGARSAEGKPHHGGGEHDSSRKRRTGKKKRFFGGVRWALACPVLRVEIPEDRRIASGEHSVPRVGQKWNTLRPAEKHLSIVVLISAL